MRRYETGEYHSGEVPLDLFKAGAFKTKEYLVQALRVVVEGVEELRISHEETIRICTGYILTQAKEALEVQGYTVESAKIVGPTQELAEREYLKTLVRLGVGDMATVASMRSFDSFLTWVLEDLEYRERFVKTGWSSWTRLKEESMNQ